MDVFIVAAVRLYGEGLTQLLGRHAELRVVGSASDSGTAVRRLRALERAPDVVLVDLHGEAGLAGVGELRDELPDLRMIIIGVDEVGAEVLRWAEAGVTGFVTRQASAADLAATVRDAANGHVHCSPEITAILFHHVGELARRARPAAVRAALTPREREIVRLIGEGLSNEQIARRLCIQLPTVKNHVHHVLEKFGVQRRAEAAALFREESPVARP
jgi:DNA-binding NarL/FixJ family response regulator